MMDHEMKLTVRYYGGLMAGVITHLVVAKEMLNFLPGDAIKNKGLFYLGTVAPDAVHAREGYIRAHKKHSHFRDDIPDRDFELPSNYALYQERLIHFINTCKNKQDGLQDYYLGYVVHILTDELFVLSIRKEFCRTMAELGIDQNDRTFFDYIIADMNRNDYLMVSQYDGMDEIRNYIEEEPAQPVEGYISSQEMKDCRDWLIYHHFVEKHEDLQPVYISYGRMMEFVQTAAAQIVKLLSDGEILPKML
jgi:hypothetical protein